VQRTVSCRGDTQIVGQRVQVGLRYAGQIVTIEVDDITLRVCKLSTRLVRSHDVVVVEDLTRIRE